MSNKNEKVIGIDLGTGNSCVGVMEGGKATVIANSEGNRTTPSVVFIKDNQREVGSQAKRKMVMNPKNTISFVKRFMGANFYDDDVQKMLKQVTYDVVNENNKPRFNIDGKKYTPEEISSYILSTMKKTAEDYYGEEVKKAVITVPAWFNDAQRQATKVAGELAGLEVLRIINEPTAAILSSNIDINGKDQTVAVFDFGCGTLDISVCELSEGLVEVLASYGDVFLGGANFDNAIVEWIVDEFKKDENFNLKNDPMAYARLMEAAEKAKCELSSSTTTEINLPYITVIDNIPKHFVKTLTRAKFNELTEDIITKAIDCTRKAFEKAGKTCKEIDRILLVGGMTRALNVQEALTKEFGLPLDKSSNPDEAVALGAVTQANIMNGGESDKDILLLDVTPISLGIETDGKFMTKLIEANTTIPTQKKQIFSTAVDNQPAVSIVVLQGERQFSRDNKVIGQFNLEGIAPARRGVPQIEVTFDIDANGIVKVSAKDLGTNKEQHITIEGGNSLSEEEIARIKAEAEKYKEEDAKRKAEADKLNEAESFAYSVRNTIEDNPNIVNESQKAELTEKINNIIDAVKNNDISGAETYKKSLEEAFKPIAENLYKNANNSQPNSNAFNDIFNQANGFNFNQNSAKSSSDSTNSTNDVPFEEVK